MFRLNGKTLPIDTAFIHNDIQYPANWLRYATAEEKAALGITEVAEQPRPDDRFYFVTDNGDGTYTATPKDLAGLKMMLCKECDEAAWHILMPTDYIVIKKATDPNYVPDAAIMNWREAVRQACRDHKARIMATTTVEELAALGAAAFPEFGATP